MVDLQYDVFPWTPSALTERVRDAEKRFVGVDEQVALSGCADGARSPPNRSYWEPERRCV